MSGRTRTLATLAGLLALAALLRLPNLITRGTWDGDQGHDMLVLRALVQDGVVPLLGPPTSIGDVHHGAWYYYLLAPAAALTAGESPTAVVALIALAGIAAVGVTWWLARAIGGPIAGGIAGLVMAVSIAAVDESTFIWNPNLIALSASVALAAAWHAWQGASPRWWIVAAIGVAVTMQCHVLGFALLPIVGAALVADGRRRPLGVMPLSGIFGVFALAYLPLAINELTTDFSETRAALDYLAGDREAGAAALPVRFGIVGLRVVSWPLTGLIVDGFLAGTLALIGVIAIAAWLWLRGTGPERQAARWLGLGLLWTTAFLAVAAPSLAAVVRGLPNDHYHAFADPAVFALVGVGAAAAWRQRPPVGRVVAVTVVVALLGWNLTRLPPAVHPDGGWPAGEAAGVRVDAALSEAGLDRQTITLLRSLPEAKSTEALAYPLVRLGRTVMAETSRGLSPGSVTSDADPAAYVMLCDDLFQEAIGAPCGGPAEDAEAADAGWGGLIDRFEAAPGRWMSVYEAPAE